MTYLYDTKSFSTLDYKNITNHSAGSEKMSEHDLAELIKKNNALIKLSVSINDSLSKASLKEIDCRRVFFSHFASRVQTYVLDMLAMFHYMSWSELNKKVKIGSLDFKNECIILAPKSEVMTRWHRSHKTEFLPSMVGICEYLFDQLLEAISPSKKAPFSWSKKFNDYPNLFNDPYFLDDDKDALLFITKIRNTMHSNGIYIGNDIRFKNFELLNRKQILFYSHENLYQWGLILLHIMNKILNLEPIRKIKHIEDRYSTC